MIPKINLARWRAFPIRVVDIQQMKDAEEAKESMNIDMEVEPTVEHIYMDLDKITTFRLAISHDDQECVEIIVMGGGQIVIFVSHQEFLDEYTHGLINDPIYVQTK